MLIMVMMFIFPKFLSLMFLGKFGPIICFFSNWLKFRRGVHYYMLITVLRFVFSKLFSFTFFGQIWSQYLKFFKLTVIWYRGRFLNPYFDFNVYFSGILIILIFLDKFGPKSELPQINWNLVQVYIAICLLRF